MAWSHTSWRWDVCHNPLIRFCFGHFLKTKYTFNGFWISCCAHEPVFCSDPLRFHTLGVSLCNPCSLCCWPLSRSPALIRGKCLAQGPLSTSASGNLAPSMNAEMKWCRGVDDGYHCTCVEQHISFISLYLTEMSHIPNIMQSYATFDSLAGVKRLILMDLYCSIVYSVIRPG